MTRAASLVAISLWLAACASTPTSVDPDLGAWEQRQNSLWPAQSWDIKGRISLKNSEDGYSGALDWRQKGDDLDFRFRGPLGVGSFQIVGDPAGMTVTTSKGEVFDVTDAELDLEQQFGWRIPVHSMRFWVTGVPNPEFRYDAVVDQKGQASEMSQQGWDIEYKSYRRFEGVVLPRRMEMRSGDLRIRLAVDRWNSVPKADTGGTDR